MWFTNNLSLQHLTYTVNNWYSYSNNVHVQQVTAQLEKYAIYIGNMCSALYKQSLTKAAHMHYIILG